MRLAVRAHKTKVPHPVVTTIPVDVIEDQLERPSVPHQIATSKFTAGNVATFGLTAMLQIVAPNETLTQGLGAKPKHIVGTLVQNAGPRSCRDLHKSPNVRDDRRGGGRLKLALAFVRVRSIAWLGRRH